MNKWDLCLRFFFFLAKKRRSHLSPPAHYMADVIFSFNVRNILFKCNASIKAKENIFYISLVLMFLQLLTKKKKGNISGCMIQSPDHDLGKAEVCVG